MNVIKYCIFSLVLGITSLSQDAFAAQQAHLNNIRDNVNTLLADYPELSQSYLAGLAAEQVVQDGIPRLDDVQEVKLSFRYPAVQFYGVVGISNLGHAFVFLKSLINTEEINADEAYAGRPEFDMIHCRFSIPVRVSRISGRAQEIRDANDRLLRRRTPDEVREDLVNARVWLATNVSINGTTGVMRLHQIPTTDVVSVSNIKTIIGHVRRVLNQVLNNNIIAQQVINLYSSFITHETKIIDDNNYAPVAVRDAVQDQIRIVLGATKNLRERVRAPGVREQLFSRLGAIESELQALEALEAQVADSSSDDSDSDDSDGLDSDLSSSSEDEQPTRKKACKDPAKPVAKKAPVKPAAKKAPAKPAPKRGRK